MNEEQYRQVCEACDRVLLAPDSTLERISIPWLHVLREHPSFLKNYEGLFATSTVLRGASKGCAAKIRSAAGWLCQMWRALRSDGEPWKASAALLEPIEILFVSHLLNDANEGKSDDFYFGNLPELMQAQGCRVVVALIDHSVSQDASRAKLWSGGAVPRVMLPRTLGVRGELSLFRRLWTESSRLASLSRREVPSLLKKVFARASLEAISGGARATLRMSAQIGHLVATIKPKMMIVTYEGHAWERVAFSAAHEASPGVQCVGYQHAAIFRLQHAALRKLGLPFDPDFVLTSGSVSKAQIEDSMKAQGVPVRVLGSSRALGALNKAEAGGRGADDVDAMTAAPAGNACLVLPEGIISECLLLFGFSLRCAELMPDMRFIWRLHPLVQFEALTAQNPAFQKLPRNVILSTVSMEEDIERAGSALYRGSTAIVKAVCDNVLPVYLVLPDEMTIDPLYQLGSWRERVSKPEEFFTIVSGRSLASGASEGQIAAAQYCSDFYKPIDPSVLLDMLQSLEKT